MRPEKTQLVQDIREVVESSGGLFVISFKGLTTGEFNALRQKLDECESRCRVVPRRLFGKAVAEAGLDAGLDVNTAGEMAVVTAGNDPVGVAKRLREFGKTHVEAGVRFGVLDGKHISGAQVGDLADLPPLAVLQAQLLGVLLAPAGQVVRLLSANLASVVYVLGAYLNEKEKAA